MLRWRTVLEKMSGYNFSELYPKESNPRTRIRLLGMAHIQEGKSCAKVGAMLKVCRSTVHRWVKRFINEGLSGLIDRPGRGTHQKLAKEDEQAFKKAVYQLQKDRKGGRVTGKEIQQMLADRFKVRYSLNGVYELLKRLKIVWITCRSMHPKADPKAQEDFKRNFPNKVKEVLPEEVKIKQVDIWFQDETRVGQRGTVSRIWAEKGTRPRIVQQQQFDSAYIFGAACPQKDEAVALVLPETNTQGMNLHLQTISSAVPEGRHAVVVADRASWHTTDKLVIPENMSLLPLPPYSPELNPVDRIWEQLRQTQLANRCYEGYEAIVNTCCEAWNAFAETVGAIKSLCSRKWAVV